MTKHTPTLNLPYPESGDAPRGWEQIQALAEAIDRPALLNWQPVPLASGYTSTGSPAQYAIGFGLVWLRGGIRRTSGDFPDGDSTVSTAMPVPESGISMPAAVQFGVAAPPTCRIDVSTTGVMKVYIYSRASWVSLDSLTYAYASAKSL